MSFKYASIQFFLIVLNKFDYRRIWNPAKKFQIDERIISQQVVLIAIR